MKTWENAQSLEWMKFLVCFVRTDSKAAAKMRVHKREAIVFSIINPRPVLFTMGRERHCKESCYPFPANNIQTKGKSELKIDLDLDSRQQQRKATAWHGWKPKPGEVKVESSKDDRLDQSTIGPGLCQGTSPSLAVPCSCRPKPRAPLQQKSKYWESYVVNKNIQYWVFRSLRDIKGSPARFAGIGSSFNPGEGGGQEVKVLLRQPLKLLKEISSDFILSLWPRLQCQKLKWVKISPWNI